MDKITREKLKQDKFAEEVTSTVDFLSEHRSESIKYGVAALAVVVVVAGFFVYRSQQADARREALAAALEIKQAAISATQGDPNVKSYPTEEARNKASIAAFTELASKYSGSQEGIMAQFYLGSLAADSGNGAGAVKLFQEVVDSGDDNYSSLAKLQLAELYKEQGKIADGEKLLRSLIEKPSGFVSKEQATITLARYLAPSNPTEARKLLEPLRTERNAVSRSAITALGELPQK